METVRDIVVIVFAITGTITSVVLGILGFKLYSMSCRSLQRIDHVAGEIHETTHDVRSGINFARGIAEVASVLIPGTRLFTPIRKGAITVSKVVRSVSRLKGNSKP